jgi:F-type H+-transporting ATPase subunit b
MNISKARPGFYLALIMAILASIPQSAFAAEEGKWGIWLGVGRFLNLFLVIAVVILVTRKPLSNFFSGRTRFIQEQLAEAQEARRVAEAKVAEIESRMGRLDDELREIKAAAEKEAQDEYQRLLAAAEQDAKRIVDRSRQEIEGLTRAAQTELKAHAAELSVQLAEEKIRSEITDADRERLVANFVAKLGGGQ